MSASFWRPPSADSRLGENQVHVWRARLDLVAARARSYESLLTENEIGRAERFFFEKDRTSFVVARGILKVILARYLVAPPSELRFEQCLWGKPVLSSEFAARDVRFNLSHSGTLALYAVSKASDVGIDVEEIKRELAGEEIAERFFSPGEVEAIRALPPESQVDAFFACWTRKEAFVKGTGRGLSVPLDRFEVTVAPGGPAALVSTAFEPALAEQWSLVDIDAGPGYRAALAVHGPGRRPSLHDFPLD